MYGNCESVQKWKRTLIALFAGTEERLTIFADESIRDLVMILIGSRDRPTDRLHQEDPNDIYSFGLFPVGVCVCVCVCVCACTRSYTMKKKCIHLPLFSGNPIPFSLSLSVPFPIPFAGLDSFNSR